MACRLADLEAECESSDVRFGAILLFVALGACSADPSPQGMESPNSDLGPPSIEASETVQEVLYPDAPAPFDSAAGPTADPRAPSDMARILEDFCPFELGCDFGPTLVGGEVPVYSERGDRSSQIGVVGPDECVSTTRGDMVIDQPGLVVVKQSRRPFEAGDSIWVMTYAGEGSYIVWSGGRQWNVLGEWPRRVGVSDLAETLRTPISTWWIELETTPPSWIALRNAEASDVRFDHHVEFPNLAQGIHPCGPG